MNLRKPKTFLQTLGAAGCAVLLAASNTHGLTVAWDANSDPDLAGYRLYYGTASSPYSNVIDLTNTSAVVSGLQQGATYTFAVTAYNANGLESAYSSAVSYTQGSDHAIPTAILANISTRAFVQSGENVLIGGFIIDGIVPKKVALRAIGPSLATVGITNALADPVLQLADSTGQIVASNDNWNVPGQQISSYGLAPADSRESALVATLSPGAYSAIVSGKGGGSGIGLFELYDLESDFGRVANISTRSRVEPGNNVMIGGFILTGSDYDSVIVRALGPSLGALGVHGFLADPSLEVYDSYGTVVGANDNWRSSQQTQIINTQLPPANDAEAAIVVSLFPGAYTSIVQGVNGGSGVALVEVYALN